MKRKTRSSVYRSVGSDLSRERREELHELELFRRLDEIEKSDPELYAEVFLGAEKLSMEEKSRCRCEG